ncbi:Fe2+-enterobactin ABC transporter substrate-binding protein [Pseudomonas wadenswilerensis]|uniref:Ferrienterobactin-binding periplasmic protein n=1 Tax=Pseudomonas wadenswilerensis TaxID=1785161 RepID=A0A380T2U8_9PSED|nr:Fe2+-enterobactin ABC transporter substrate-binding protein [Pseudomonas wadenswilerensis]UVM23365.1 Fe2+-enterobactin ABC transporter substrate-binding protein [Pseudomonas wadenswilerensis]SUQ64579.1 Ferrienterobactin-binding periplasmic protein [Pseudomonas wadenswilerensis]
MKKLTFAPTLAVAALILLACTAVGLRPATAVAAGQSKPLRIASTSPSVTGILLAMKAPLVATAATTPSRMTDSKGFFSQWASVADARQVEVLYPNLVFDIEAVLGVNPDLLVLAATGADSVVQHQAELEAQGIPTLVVNYSNQSWQEIATTLGKAAGLEAQAQAAIKDFDDYAALTAASINPPKGGVSIVGYNIGGSYSVGRASSPQARLFTALGVKVASLPPALSGEVTRAVDFEFISRENLSAAITGESVFLLGATDADVQAFLADPLLANLPAVTQNKVYALGPTSFRVDYYSGRQMIDTVARHLR